MTVTTSVSLSDAFVAGWPCALLPTTAPSVADRLSAPTADEVLPQLLQLTPRGPAWGTDEAGSGQGAEPVMLGVWRAIAGHAAANYKIEYDLATQCFPSGITFSLADWEAEYALPDPCFSGQTGFGQRVASVRAKFGAIGGQSPAYFICLAKSIGYDIAIEEPTQFLCDVSECVDPSIGEDWFFVDDGTCETTPIESFTLPEHVDDGDQVSDESVWKYWVVKVGSLGETFFYADDGVCDFDPLEGFYQRNDLECLLGRYAPPHTKLIFDYSPLA